MPSGTDLTIPDLLELFQSVVKTSTPTKPTPETFTFEGPMTPNLRSTFTGALNDVSIFGEQSSPSSTTVSSVGAARTVNECKTPRRLVVAPGFFPNTANCGFLPPPQRPEKSGVTVAIVSSSERKSTQ